jgi:hypothetical protein
MRNDLRKYFGTEPECLRDSLGRMVQESYQESNYSMDECYRRTRTKLDYDRRFDGYDKDRLVAKAKEVGASGGHLDMDDPWLFPGGEKRPFSR